MFLSWHQMLENLHNTLCEYAARKISDAVRTTVSALLKLRTGFIAQVGINAIYLDDGTGTEQLTKDQTLAMREVEAGRLSPEAMQTDQRKNILLQCLDMEKNGTCVPEQTTPTEGRCSVVQ